MALGKRKSETQELWVATTDLPRSPGHHFYKHSIGCWPRMGSTAGWKNSAGRIITPRKAARRSRPASTSA